MRIYRLHHIKAIIIKTSRTQIRSTSRRLPKRLKKMLYSKWGFLFLIFQFVLMKVSPCPSKSLTNIWFELTYIGISRIAKRCWPICYVNWGSGWKLKSVAKTLDLQSRMSSTESTLAPTGCSQSKVLDVKVSFLFFFFFFTHSFFSFLDTIIYHQQHNTNHFLPFDRLSQN